MNRCFQHKKEEAGAKTPNQVEYRYGLAVRVRFFMVENVIPRSFSEGNV